MKKLILFLLITTMLVSVLSACNNKPEPPPTEPASPETQVGIGTQPQAKPTPETQVESGTQPSSGQDNEQDFEAIEILLIDGFSDGLAKFATNDGYGYMDATGKIVIAPQYKYAEDFNTLAKVQKNNEDNHQYINKSGQTVYSFTGKEAGVGDFSNGYFWVETVNETISGDVHTMTYYDQNGNKVFTIENAAPTVIKYPQNNLMSGITESKCLSSFNEWGYAVVTIENYQKFIDTQGNVVSLSSFGLTDFEENYTVTRMVGNYVTIDRSLLFIDFENKSAKVIGSAETLSMYIYDLEFKQLNNDYYASYERLCYRSSKGNRVLNHKAYRYISKNNQIIFDLYSVQVFRDAYIIDVEHVEIKGKSYFNVVLINTNDVIFSAVVDISGNIVIGPTKDIILAERSYYTEALTSIFMDYSAYNNHSGLFLVHNAETGTMGYVDINGTFVINPTHSSATEFQIIDSVAVAVVNGNTIINNKGEILFSVQAE